MESETEELDASFAAAARGYPVPKTMPWKRREGPPLTLQEALQLAKEAGVELPHESQALFRIGKYFSGEFSNAYAYYLDLGVAPPQRITRAHLEDEDEECIVVYVRASVLESEEETIAVFAHESYEILGLLKLFDELEDRGENGMPRQQLYGLINTRSGSLHCEAWQYADRLVTTFRMRSSTSDEG